MLKQIFIEYNNVQILCGYFCIRLIDFMLKAKSLLNYRNLFSPKDYENKDKIILKYFQQLKILKTYIGLFVVSTKSLRKVNVILLGKNISSIIYSK